MQPIEPTYDPTDAPSTFIPTSVPTSSPTLSCPDPIHPTGEPSTASVQEGSVIVGQYIPGLTKDVFNSSKVIGYFNKSVSCIVNEFSYYAVSVSILSVKNTPSPTVVFNLVQSNTGVYIEYIIHYTYDESLSSSVIQQQISKAILSNTTVGKETAFSVYFNQFSDGTLSIPIVEPISGPFNRTIIVPVTNSPVATSSSGNDLSSGAVAAISVTIIVICCLICIFLVILYWRRSTEEVEYPPLEKYVEGSVKSDGARSGKSMTDREEDKPRPTGIFIYSPTKGLQRQRVSVHQSAWRVSSVLDWYNGTGNNNDKSTVDNLTFDLPYYNNSESAASTGGQNPDRRSTIAMRNSKISLSESEKIASSNPLKRSSGGARTSGVGIAIGPKRVLESDVTLALQRSSSGGGSGNHDVVSATEQRAKVLSSKVTYDDEIFDRSSEPRLADINPQFQSSPIRGSVVKAKESPKAAANQDVLPVFSMSDAMRNVLSMRSLITNAKLTDSQSSGNRALHSPLQPEESTKIPIRTINNNDIESARDLSPQPSNGDSGNSSPSSPISPVITVRAAKSAGTPQEELLEKLKKKYLVKDQAQSETLTSSGGRRTKPTTKQEVELLEKIRDKYKH